MTDVSARTLITPYGGRLVDLFVPAEEVAEVRAHAATLSSVQISDRAACDLELLATGGFSPLDRFMNERDYRSVLDGMRLGNGVLFPIPITLTVPADASAVVGGEIALRDSRNDLLAVMKVEERYEWDPAREALAVLGTNDAKHPLIAEMQQWGAVCLSGALRVLALPRRSDFRELRRTPQQVRDALAALGRSDVVAFQTRNPLHRVHEELTRRAVTAIDGVLLLHPVVGMTRPGDVDHYTRVRTYKALSAYYEEGRILLSLLPLAMRMAGPREALWHALIRRNYGANHFIVGRDHASPGNDSAGRPFWGPYEAQELVTQHALELGIDMVPFEELVYLPEEQRYEQVSRVQDGARTLSLSGTQVRSDYLEIGVALPEWFTRPAVGAVLAETYPPRHRQGVCVWFTGLSGAGKSATADALQQLLLEHGRQATMLDGDVVRTHLSKGLGFSKEDRDTNIRRIGFVAAEVVRHGGVAICAAVSPYRSTRDEVRRMVGAAHFLEVFVDTPLSVCESRDVKGMYAQARQGLVKNFTGIDDPYEAPQAPEVVLETTSASIEENAALIVAALTDRGFVRS